MLNAIIVEDDIAAEANLRFLLTKHCDEDIRILTSASSGQKGIGSIDSLNPDIVFLDIYLGDMTAFEVLDRVKSKDMQVIFTTSYDQDSIRPLRNRTIDYLQKPISKQDLLAAVARAEKKTIQSNDMPAAEIIQPAFRTSIGNHSFRPNPAFPEKIALTTSEGLMFVKISSIVVCESERVNTVVTLETGEKIKVFKPITQLEEILVGQPFFRVHPFFLINTQRIRKFLRADGGTVVMENGMAVTVARNKLDEFLDLFTKF